jgi:hypothetical protein
LVGINSHNKSSKKIGRDKFTQKKKKIVTVGNYESISQKGKHFQTFVEHSSRVFGTKTIPFSMECFLPQEQLVKLNRD